MASQPLPAGGCIDAPPATVVWAQAVSAQSSEFDPVYWGAAQAVGPPDVYPCYGDIVGTWASAGPDEAEEFITVDLGAPVDAVAVLIVETFARGAVSAIAVSADALTFTDVATMTPIVEPAGSCIRRVALATPALGFRYLSLATAESVHAASVKKARYSRR